LIEADVEKSSQKLSSQHAVHLIAVRIYVFTVNDLGRTTRRQERFNGGRISESGVVARKIADDNHAETFLEIFVAVAAVIASRTGAAPAALSLSAVSALTFRLFYGLSDGLFDGLGNRLFYGFRDGFFNRCLNRFGNRLFYGFRDGFFNRCLNRRANRYWRLFAGFAV
jgi:uncharacterized MAPEG superfamily protein